LNDRSLYGRFAWTIKGNGHLAVILSETARSSPDRPVVVYDGGQLTYAELDQASDRLAAALVAAG
jgi:non-ribosomal peptide synthetase component E (peptide arylation enzyme)